MAEARLGKLLLKNELVTAGQIQDALVKQLSTPEIPLGQILCQMGALRPEDLQMVLDRSNKRQKLDDILLKNKLIDESGLSDAVNLSREERIPLDKSLLKLNLVSEENLARAIASQFDLPFMDITQFRFDPDLARILNANFAQRHKIVPVASDGQTVTIAMSFPLQRNELRQIENFIKFRVKPVIAKERDISAAMQQLFNIEKPPAASPAAVSIEITDNASRDTSGAKTTGEAVNASIDHLVKNLLFLGISKGARDIHLEFTEKDISVRYRIDGALQKLDMGEDKALIIVNRQLVVSRIKSLCEMDIAEKRRPQDGTFSVKALRADEIRRFDLCVSTVPARHGENVAIRIFDRNAKVNPIENLGYFPDQVKALAQALMIPAGIFLICGPFDSGKSLTLHAMLSKIMTPESKTLTIEDPVEFVIEGATQTEVNESIGNTFAKLLHAYSRQNADNILVGEIRDPETARAALHAALTGRTVLGAINTHDATSAVTRLLDFGIEASIVSSTLRCVLAQRLIRHICRECTTPHIPSPEIMKAFGLPYLPRLTLKKGKGCDLCNYTGFNGRRPIIELWLPTREELAQIDAKPDAIRLRNIMFAPGTRTTLLEDGFKRVLAGITTLEELLRVVPQDQITSDRDRLLSMLAS